MVNEGVVEKLRREMRRVERRHLVFYLRVFDGMSTKVLGHIVNISANGAMLISDNPIPVDTSFRLRMRLPARGANKDEIIFNATSRWCRQDVNPDFFISGIQMYDVDEEVSRYILCLMDDFSFRDPV